MIATRMPPQAEMMTAFLAGDGAYDGLFITAVKTTGIFCRPSCPARKPLPKNVEFYDSARAAANAGYRPCKRCKPLETPGSTPEWLKPLLEAVETNPTRRWRDADLREMELAPERVRRWFVANHSMTFHAYSRARRMGVALGRIKEGGSVTETAFDSGYDSLSGFGDAFRSVFGDAPKNLAAATRVKVKRIATPLGAMIAGATDDAVCLLEFVERRMLATQLTRLRERLSAVMVPGTSGVLSELEEQLEAYFAGDLSRFTVPLRAPGTEFQESVWERLREVPYGETRSYGELAKDLGRPTASRAVARANGDNRIAILIPCHRVIGADGSLTGYGGGLWRKERLLALEGVAR